MCEYLGEICGQVLKTFSEMTVIDPLGQDVTPEKVKREQEKNDYLFN